MKRLWIVIVNISIMIAMITFVALYATFESQSVAKRQVEHFENTAITMEHVTENYLEGEQRICDVWAHHINFENLTIEEAVEFIHNSHVLSTASAHIVYTSNLTGLSTRAREGTSNNAVSYVSMDFLQDTSWIHALGEGSINISRAYTNPINAEQSIAFCNFITLKDTGNGSDAILLRLLPVSELVGKWVFPQEEFENAEFSIIDFDGSYIIRRHSFKGSSFFEFYKSYNSNVPNATQQELFKKITTTTGSFTMYVNLEKDKSIVAYTPFDATGGWILLSLMPVQYLMLILKTGS